MNGKGLFLPISSFRVNTLCSTRICIPFSIPFISPVKQLVKVPTMLVKRICSPGLVLTRTLRTISNTFMSTFAGRAEALFRTNQQHHLLCLCSSHGRSQGCQLSGRSEQSSLPMSNPYVSSSPWVRVPLNP